MSKNDGGPAFPVVASNLEYICASGVSIRDFFAAKALQGVLTGNRNLTAEEYAQASYRMADAMLKAREEE